MEKSCSSSSSSALNSTATSNTPNHHFENYLKQLNRASHKISKPPIVRKTQSSLPLHQSHHRRQQEELHNHNHNQNQNQTPHQNQHQNPQQNQPPVYNINKSDFREVVQKLTGSPAHERFSTPPPPLPPIHSPKPQSSRLQRIRPPPLAHLTTRPPSPMIPITNQDDFSNNGRSISPLSPLPPFPTVHAAAESPISAYMKYLRGSMSTADSPRWFSTNSMSQQAHQGVHPPPGSQFIMPNSPLAFGRIPSPNSPYHPLLSPSLLFSPTTGFPQFHY